MAMTREHELHRRRFGRNLGVALALAALIALVFGLTIVKVTRGDQMQAYDHAYRPEMEPAATAPVVPGTGGNP